MPIMDTKELNRVIQEVADLIRMKQLPVAMQPPRVGKAFVHDDIMDAWRQIVQNKEHFPPPFITTSSHGMSPVLTPKPPAPAAADIEAEDRKLTE